LSSRRHSAVWQGFEKSAPDPRCPAAYLVSHAGGDALLRDPDPVARHGISCLFLFGYPLSSPRPSICPRLRPAPARQQESGWGLVPARPQI
jgi:hypothetical protein